MRVSKIYVTKLFGIFNHSVLLNSEDRITIIHGPNGVGKTALLRLINGFFDSQYSELRSVPFTELRLDFDDGSYVQITKYIEQGNENETDPKLTINFYVPGAETQIFSPNLFTNSGAKIDWHLSATEDEVNSLIKVGEQGKVESLYPLENFANSFLKSFEKFASRLKKEPKWLSELKSSIDVRFIESQRLLKISSVPEAVEEMKHSSMIPSVDTYSQELAEYIQAKLAEYGTLSQSLDRTFPARVVNNKAPSDLTEETLLDKLNEIEEQRSRLIKTGLLDKEETPDIQVQQDMDETTKNILYVYLEDVAKKNTLFNELATKIELFQRIITQRFRYKTIRIDKNNGFIFTTPDGKPLSPTDLSSGEQHELVMLYELLFKVKPNSLILIDEPEISLHVAWQVDFLKDLQAIIKLVNFDVLIATHSPSIIDDRWDLTVGLKGPVE